MIRWSADVGAERAYIISDETNKVSSNAILDVGFDPLSPMALYRLGPLALASGSQGTLLRRTGGVIGLPNA